MKMTSVFIMIFMFIVTACDQPALNRAANGTFGTGADVQFAGGGSTIDDDENTNNGNFNETNQGQHGPGYENCNFNVTQSAGSSINSISVCQSELDLTKIKAKFSDQDFVEGTCFVPMHKQSGGNSFYLGIAQCTYHSNDQIVEGTLVKNRPGFSQYNINNIMILKKDSINAFFACMDATSVYISQNCPGVQDVSCNSYYGQTRTACMQCMGNANNYKNLKCNQFVNGHDFISWNP